MTKLHAFMTAYVFAQAPLRRLPVRDGDVWLYAVAGLALLILGGALIVVARRRDRR